MLSDFSLAANSSEPPGAISKLRGLCAFGGGVFDQRQRPFTRVDGEYGNAVMSAVRGIEELAGRMNCDLSSPRCAR